jgi:hypothetical protein
MTASDCQLISSNFSVNNNFQWMLEKKILYIIFTGKKFDEPVINNQTFITHLTTDNKAGNK